jgi:hypothetical protein
VISDQLFAVIHELGRSFASEPVGGQRRMYGGGIHQECDGHTRYSRP